MADLDPQIAQMMQQFTQALGNMNAALEKAGVNVTKFAGTSVKTVQDNFKKLDADLKSGAKSFKNIGPELQELQKQISLETDGKKRASLQTELLSKSQQAMVSVLKDGAAQVAGLAAQAFGSYYKQQVMTGVRGIMGDGSPFQVAADLQTAAIDSSIKAAQGLAGVGTTVGTALMMIPTPATILAGTLTVLGSQLFGKLAGEAGELLKFQVEVTSKAIERTYNAFQQASSAGALFAGGITELRGAAIQAGIGQEKFSAIIANNSVAMVEFGGNVAIGAKRLAAVAQAGMGARQSLLNMGISIEDQIQGTAEYMAMLQRTGSLRGKSDQDLAKESEAYLVNLRAVSSITGEDAKTAAARAKEAANAAAVRSKLSQMGPQATAKFEEMVRLYGKGNEKAIQDLLLFGEVQGEAAIGFAQLPTQARLIRDSLSGVIDNNVSLGQITDQFQTGVQQNQSALLQEGQLAADTVGLVNQLTGQMTGAITLIQQSLTLGMRDFTKVLETPMDEAKKAKDTQDAFTKSVTAGVVKLNELSVAIDNMLTGAIRRFADDVPDILEGFRKKLVQLGLLDEGPGRGPGPAARATEDTARAAVAQATGATPESVTAEAVAAQQARMDVEAALAARNARRAVIRNRNAATNRPEESVPEEAIPQATGGVLKPRRGGQLVLAAEAGLHEAFVPLPDGKTIPVSLNVELTQLLKDNNVVITNVSKDLRDAMQSMLRNSGDIDTSNQDQMIMLMTQFVEAQREAKREMEDQTQALRRLYDAYA